MKTTDFKFSGIHPEWDIDNLDASYSEDLCEAVNSDLIIEFSLDAFAKVESENGDYNFPSSQELNVHSIEIFIKNIYDANSELLILDKEQLNCIEKDIIKEIKPILN